MKSARILTVAALLLVPAVTSAQQVVLTLQNGRVSLDAKNVPVRQILSEWARIGGVMIVNGDKIIGPPVTLQLPDVPERQALDILLRGVSGYMLGVRPPGSIGASMFDRILIMATSVAPRPPMPAAAASPRTTPYQQSVENFPDGVPDGRDTTPDVARRPIAPSIIRPLISGMPPENPQQEGSQPPSTASPTAANPFGLPSGSGLPGVIAPVPQQPVPQDSNRR